MTLKKEHIAFGALAALFLLFLGYETLFYDPIMPNHMEMHSMMAGRTGPSLLGFNILFWVLLFVLAYLLIRDTPKGGKEAENDALNILKDRYAKGEITREEYLQMFKDLKEG
jgi:putative membrane protein